MDRRLLIAAGACCTALPLLAQAQGVLPRHKVSAAELHRRLSARFPRRFSLGGLVDLEVGAPALLLLPARNKLGATLSLEAAGPALRERLAGELDLVFALRYEASDRSLRAHQPEVLELRLPGVPASELRALQRLLPAIQKRLQGEFVLHEFSARELALAEAMDVEPEAITVGDEGLVVTFRRRTR